MAISGLVQTLGRAGYAAQGWRQAEEAERVARLNQLKVEEQNRLDKFRSDPAQFDVPQAPQFPQLADQLGVADVPLPPQPASPATGASATQPMAPYSVRPGLALPGSVGTLDRTPEQEALWRKQQAIRGLPIFQGDRFQGTQADLGPAPALPEPGAKQDTVLVPDLGVELPTKQARRYSQLAGRMGQELTSPAVQDFITLAKSLGVDPGVAISIYALENNYGGTAASGAGAKGSMQVTKSAYDDVISSFRNSANAAKMSVTPQQMQVAAMLPTDMADATPAQLEIAGLLYISLLKNKYGVADNLIGAAYHAGPRKEIREGKAPGTYDATAGIYTKDHNAMFVGLVNQYNQLVDATAALPGAKSQTATAGAGLAAPALAAGSAQQGLAQVPAGAPQLEQPAAPAQPAAASAAPATQAPVRLKPGDFYLANPHSVPVDMQQTLGDRQELVRLIGMYQRAGMGLQAMEARQKIRELDKGLYYLQGMQGIDEMVSLRDPRRLASVLTAALGVPIGIQPRTDGKFNLFADGRQWQQGVTTEELRHMARIRFDSAFRQMSQESATKRGDKLFDAQLDIEKEGAKQWAQTLREMGLERLRAGNAQTLEILKGQVGWTVKPITAEGLAVVIPPGGVPYLFNGAGTEQTVDGVTIHSYSAAPISGFSMGTQQQIQSLAGRG